MRNLLLILEFFSGLILLFSFGALISYVFKLDKYYEEYQKNRNIDFDKSEKINTEI